MKKLETGIRNLDRLLGGGIPEKEMILVEGPPGSGKSNLGLEFLYRGVERGENGLYVSFQDTENEILRTTTFDWEFREMVESGKINITNFDPYRYDQIANMLQSGVKENNAKRVVLDPITDLDLYIDSRKDQRKNLMTIKTEMRDMDATTLLMAEKKEATELEEEVVDGILEMEVNKGEDRLDRNIYVKKLKGSDFNHGIHNYIFDSNGLKVQ